MKSLKRISKIQTKIKTVLTQMISMGVAAIIGLFLIAAPASGFSGSGAGTVANPYQITNATQLQEMKDTLWPSCAHYVLMNDIDCSDTVDWNDGKGFEPIGYYAGKCCPWWICFTGTFDGQGYVITGLYINRPDVDSVGLFGGLDHTSIKNVGLVDVDITGGVDYTTDQTLVGALWGYSHYGTASNCYSTGNVNGKNNVGGLFGNVFHATVSNCYSTANVTGTGNGVGGLASHGCDGRFINCYSTGDVSGNTNVGGLTGNGGCGYGEIRNCYSTGNVSGDTNVGGLVGYIGSGNTVSNSYSTGSVNGNSDVGGLVGKNIGSISNSYYDTNTSGQSDTGKGEPKTTVEMMTQSTFVNWDFVNIWGICEGGSYPYLLWQLPIADTTPPEITCPVDVTVEQESYDGTVVTLEATATDICGPNPVITSDELAIYPLGETVVTFTATDASGNSASCSMTVTVVDTTPPAINSISASPDVLWPPNHKMVEVVVTVECEDICDPEPFCYIVGVTINGPGDGNTEPDWELFDDEPLVVLLRAERAGGGTGRIYTIIVECMDASGNTATATVDVTVPHDQGKGKGKK